MQTAIRLFCLASLFIWGTAHGDTNERITFTRMIPVANMDDVSRGLKNIQPNSGQSALIAERCGFPNPAGGEEVAQAIIAALVGSGIKLGVKALDGRLQKQLEKYSAEYDATFTGKMPESKCWRVFRATRVAGDPPAAKIHFDALFSIDTTNPTKLTPIRIALMDPAPVKDSKKGYGVALSLKVKTATPKGFNTTAEGIVLKSNLARPTTGSPSVAYFPSFPKLCKAASSDPELYCNTQTNDIYVSQISAGSVVEMTATVAEVGAAPRLLSWAASVFSAASESIGEILAEAAAAKINPESE